MKAAQSHDLDLLRRQFGEEASTSFHTPSGNYYWYRKRQQVLALLKRHLQLVEHATRGGLVVDLGCGSGVDLFLLRNIISTAAGYVGVEGDPLLIRLCELRRQYYDAGDVSFVQHDLETKLPFDDASLSFIYCSEVVEHLLNPPLLLAEVARVLKPGGWLLLTTPNQPNVLQRSFWSKRWHEHRKRQQRLTTARVVDAAKDFAVYGHISVMPARAWDAAVCSTGFELTDFGRGALLYGGRSFFDHEAILGVTFLFQAALDLLPTKLTRAISDDVIALYRRI